jgi:hypothetical protein
MGAPPRLFKRSINYTKPAGQRQLSHVRISTAAIYATANLPKELSFARPSWDGDMRAY